MIWLFGIAMIMGSAFPFGEKVVHDEVDPPVVDPVRRQLTALADKVQNRIPAARIVAWRRVNVDLPLAVRHIRAVHVARDASMRHVLRIVIRRAVAMNDQLAVDRKSTRLNSSHVAISYSIF